MISATRGRGHGQWWPCLHPGNRLSATYYCHSCGKGSSLSGHQVHENGVVSPSVVCPHKNKADMVECADCGFHDHVTLAGWPEELANLAKEMNHGL
jgi:hypothetical protein